MCPRCVPVELPVLNDSESKRFFREVFGRSVNVLNDRYILPADDDELKRFDIFHRMIKFVLGSKNYVGPADEILSPEKGALLKEKLRVLDLGTGGGTWAIEMADEFPHVEVTGVDLAPLQPRMVPPNCIFELCDLDQGCIPYPSNSYEVVHARNMHAGIHDYPWFVRELTRILRPGGLLILIEFDLCPIADGQFAPTPTRSGIPGWCKLQEETKRCLKMRGVDSSVPERMAEFVDNTGWYESVRQQQADIPIGFWPKDPTLLTVGQLAWMNWDMLLVAVRPLLLSSGLSEAEVNVLIEDAQRDLYYPLVHIASRLYVVHAIKKDS
ncbi:S-adenosyl-L-methionine-dependent methyltransferase [Stereum hirsutum FP-91666 SS1]|uniref:S-adenosyl-L-methionine-dependent methyltransferase n=1 Tax=Stereum hirsutum (strain FP-91666) TaxID=721885 RepID=UPI000440BFAF|nr:S-adenosyl-L-methionine-dependent methyltransferase [Stereum hirsutum FP-91666 SS1]EIM90105.1 S-adenosyl-L-methionine-dependent methyltransferase [Stereum hirsutum FP-91666 SS1]